MTERREPQSASGQQRIWPDVPQPSQPRRTTKPIRFGYQRDEVVSSFQKCIRAGQEDAAVYWGLLLFDCAPEYAWKRLIVTASEDIGLGDPVAVAAVNSLYTAWHALTEANYGISAHSFTFSIMLLCRAPKNTEVEDLQSLTFLRWERGQRRDVPDFALDMHTRRGRTMKRSDRHWYASRRDELHVPTNRYTRELFRMQSELSPLLDDDDLPSGSSQGS